MNKKYTAMTTGEYAQPLHNGDDVPLTFDTPEIAFYEGKGMFGPSFYGDAFIIRAYVDEDDDECAEDFYPIYVGHNGVKWVRSTYMQVLFDILNGANNKEHFRMELATLPDCDPNKTKLAELLEAYLNAQTED